MSNLRERRTTICPAHDELLREVRMGNEMLRRLDITVHGVPSDGVLGLVQKVNCLTEFKPTLHMIRAIHSWGGKVLVVVVASGVIGALVWFLRMWKMFS